MWIRHAKPCARVAVNLLAILPLIAAPNLRAAAPVTGPIDLVTIDKSDRTLTLSAKGRPVITYRTIKLGDAPLGHKQFGGDEKTPEGRYTISGRNGGSHYHLSLRISYPNAADRAFAARNHRTPGGDIFIHGHPSWVKVNGDWTVGCIAVQDKEIEQIYAMVNPGTPINIFP